MAFATERYGMDVRCNRCGTDYEFDDALISDRGTTVQCTNCGYQFKIYPERTAVVSPERWVVRTMAGRELVHTSLRDLQRAISDRKVGPKDLLSRGNQPPRPLGSIPELEPFFTSASGGPSRGMQSAPRTLHGVAPPPSGAPRPPEVRTKATQRGFGLPSGAAGRETTGFSSTHPAGVGTGDFEQHAAPSRVLGADVEVDGAAETERQIEPPSYPESPPKGAARTGVGLGMGSTQKSGTPPAVPRTSKPPEKRPSKPAEKSGGTPPAGKTAAWPPVEKRSVTPAPAKAPTPAPAQPFVPTSTVRIESVKPPSFDSTMPAASPPRVPTLAGGTEAPEDHPPPPAKVAPAPRAQPRQPSGPDDWDATLQVPPSPSMGMPSSARLASSPRAAAPPVPPPVSTREHLASYDDLPLGDEHVDPGRRARSRWIAGVVFIAVVALLGATLGRQYLVRLSTGRKAEPAGRDDRAVRFLQEGMRLLDLAEYEGAQEQLVKAQALSDRDPGVLSALARLETARADMIWLKLRLLDPTSKDLVAATTRDLGRQALKARQAADTAFAVAADDTQVIRARIDAMRIAGDEAKAREWIAPIAANASDPQNAYVLAALDLSEAAPAFGTVIDRLRAASVSERESARARGALIYALVRAGRVVEAETELAKLGAAAHPHPLAEELKSFVGRFSTVLDAGVEAGAAAASASAAVTASPVGASADGAPGSGDAPTGDFRSRLTQAARASSSGDLTRAASLYQSVANEQPSNTEALAGLADVARRRGDSGGAARLYARVLEVNPSYLPALMATADQKWSSGDHRGAVSTYKRILEQAGPSTDYGQRAQARITEAEGSSSSASPSSPAAKTTSTASPDAPTPPTPPAEPTPPTPPSRPDIDTSDLPGVTPP